MKENKSSNTCSVSRNRESVCPVNSNCTNNANSENNQYQHWLAKVSDKLGLCCVGWYK